MLRSDVIRRVQQAIGETTDQDTPIDDWIDDAIAEIYAESDWPWKYDSTIVVAKGAIQDLTADWTVGGVALTNLTNEPATQALANNYVEGLIQLAEGHVYEIESWVLGGTMTVTPAIIEATAVAGATTIIGHDVVRLPSTLETVMNVTDNEQPLNMSRRKVPHNRFYPDPFSVIQTLAYEWGTNGVDSNGVVRLVIWPPIDTDRNYMIHYRKKPVFPTADGDDLEAVTGIPAQFHRAIVAYAIYEAKKDEYERPDQNGEYLDYQRWIIRMKKFAKSDAGKIYVLQSRTRQPMYRHQVTLPSDLQVTEGT